MSEAQGQGQATSEVQGTQEGQGQGQQAEAPEGYLSQETANKIIGDRVKEASTKAEQRALANIAAKFGYDDPAELDSVAEALKAWEEENETEADKQTKRAEKLEARAKTAEERYSTTLKTYALRDALRDAGINPERLKGAMRLADMGNLELDKEDNVSGIEDVVEAVREEAPEFFGATEAKPRVNAPQTSGTGVRKPAANAEDSNGLYGKDLLQMLTGT